MKYLCMHCSNAEEHEEKKAIVFCDDCSSIMETEKDYAGLKLTKGIFNPTERDRDIVSWYTLKIMESRFGPRRWSQYIRNPFGLKKRTQFNPSNYKE